MALGAALLISGCGYIDIEGRPKLDHPSLSAKIEDADAEAKLYPSYRSETRHRADPRLMGTVTLRPAPGSKLEGVVFEVRKIPKGYAAETRLADGEPFQTNFTVSADKEHDLMAGIVFKMKF